MTSGLLFAILSSLLSSVALLFESAATKALHPFAVASFVSLFGAVFLLPSLFTQKKKISMKELLSNRRELLLIIFSRGVIGKVLLALGLSLTIGVKAIFFTKIEPYFVVFWFWILNKEAVKKKHLLLIFIHILGVITLSTGGILKGIGRPQLGDLLIIAAMGFHSFSYHPSSNLTKKLGAIQTNIIVLTASGLLLLPLAIVFSDSKIWQPSIGWVYLLADALLFYAIGLTFWFLSLKTVKGWMVSALRSVGPLLGVPFAFIVFKEALTPVQLLGGAIVLTTSVLIAREHLIEKKTQVTKI